MVWVHFDNPKSDAFFFSIPNFFQFTRLQMYLTLLFDNAITTNDLHHAHCAITVSMSMLSVKK